MATKNITIDTFTELISRVAFEDQYIQLFDHAKKSGEPISLAFLDIDDMRLINDRHGHIAGDAVIKHVAGIILANAGQDSICARFGGEEFAIIFPETDREQAFLTLERIRSEIEANNTLLVDRKPIDIQITVSGGLAAFPFDGRNNREVIRKADQAMYRAKSTGRNKICLSQEERMVTKTTHFTPTQLERLASLSQESNIGEAELLREALDDLLIKYDVSEIET